MLLDEYTIDQSGAIPGKLIIGKHEIPVVVWSIETNIKSFQGDELVPELGYCETKSEKQTITYVCTSECYKINEILQVLDDLN